MNDFHSESIDTLFQVILELKDLDECYKFFSDVCTIKELQDMSQRLAAAVLLAEGENYQNITKQVGISGATISRVSRCLNYGSGGYPLALRKLKEVNKQNDDG